MRRLFGGLIVLLLVMVGNQTIASADGHNASDCRGAQERNIRIANSSKRIYLQGCDETFTMADIVAEAGDRHVEGDGETFLVKKNIIVEEGVTLRIENITLRLQSNSGKKNIVSIKAVNGNILIDNAEIMSWDTRRNRVDTKTSDGRAFIAVRSQWTRGRDTVAPTACDVDGGSQEYYEGSMSISDSYIHHLGYKGAEAYGLSWKVYSKDRLPGRELYDRVDVFGDVINTRIANNYFGVYQYGAYCSQFLGNVVEDNLVYGIDPHDDSDSIRIEGNTVRNNGKHGVICSRFCSDFVVIDNFVHGNSEHGVMTHRRVDGAIVSNNRIENNGKVGLAVFDSYDGTYNNNVIRNNRDAQIRLSVGASGNVFENNILEANSKQYLIKTYRGSDKPTFGGNRYVRFNEFTDNDMTADRTKAINLKEARGNGFAGPPPDAPEPWVRERSGSRDNTFTWTE